MSNFALHHRGPVVFAMAVERCGAHKLICLHFIKRIAFGIAEVAEREREREKRKNPSKY